MNKYISIKQPLHELPGHTLTSLIGSLLTELENLGYAYDMEEEVVDRVKEILDDHDIEWEMEYYDA